MALLSRLGLPVCAILALAALAPAQATLEVPDTVSNGQEIHIIYKNPDKAGDTVSIVIRDGLSEPVTVTGTVNEDGVATIPWTVTSQTVLLSFAAVDATATAIVQM